MSAARYYDDMAAHERTDELFNELTIESQAKIAKQQKRQAKLNEQMRLRPNDWSQIIRWSKKHPSRKRPKVGRDTHPLFTSEYRPSNELVHNLPGAGNSAIDPWPFLLHLSNL